SLDEQGDTVWGNREKQSEKINYYHKPQFSLKDTWKVNDKFFVSNTLYMSIGNGGGTGLLASPRLGTRETPNIDFQSMYDTNYDNFRESSGYRESRNLLNSSVNNHFWYGLLSSAEYQLDESLTLSGGIDLRSYTGEHYQEIYDLLGGEIHLDEQGNTPNYSNPDRNRYKRVGDKIRFHNDGLVKWYGVFGQLEYITPNWSGFVSSSVSDVSYQRIDYFAPYYYEDTEIKMRRRTNLDPTLYFSDTLNIDGEQYYIGHPEVTQKNKYSAKQNIWGYTVKAGFNYNLTERVNAFINLGNLSRAPRFNNAFGRNVNTIPKNLKNEQVYAVELGTGFNSSKFSYNINGYFTYWLNKPLDYALSISVDDETYFLHLTGLAARHMGIEFDAVYKPIKELEIQGLFSLGDWIYKSADSVSYVDVAGNPAPVTAINYDAKGVHVGDAAQTQIGGSVRYYPIKDLFMQARATYFARNFANFNPESLQKTTEYDYRGRESWLMPSYGLVDVSIGYSFQIYEKYKAGINFNVLNLFDTMYITDATNNDSNLEIGGQNTFDGRAAGIYMGMGRRFNLSFRVFF
ncbi:MAG: TonB-dependent receptor, partial [Salinivirgaceae bacterium]|nr:TonB-dependent receptor [Salinivirgaceae bacterium]